jgi:long-chain acyl-CoA synthetase
MSAVVLLTGATGFLGSHIAGLLLQDAGTTLIALVRAEDRGSAAWRLARAWWDWPDLAAAIGSRIEVRAGDVSLPHLGLDDATYTDLVHQVTHIIHAAADLRINAPIDVLRRTNVQGTVQMLEFARAAHRDHGLRRFSHISTAYVAGGRRGAVPEEALTDAYGFSCAYEFSKYEGERLVQAAKEELPVSVFRPGMIVGDSRTGAIKTFNTFYFPIRLYLEGKLRVMPARPDLRVNIVPVDYVAEAVVRLTFEPQAEGLNFHLTAPREALPTARELVALTRAWAREHLGLQLPRPLFIPLPEALTRGRYRPERVRARQGESVLDALISFMPYFNERLAFQRDNVDRLLGPYPIVWRQLVPALLEYATARSFMHRSGRTVHEQILHRLQSKSRRVTFHDVVQGRVLTRETGEVRRDMLAAAEALRGLGVRPGDRVALVGLNSSRYLTLDVAIGVAGAVSVPLYYTSPPGELKAILDASGARLLLVGAPGLLERLGDFAGELPVVSFCREPLPEGLSRRVMAWEAFLALGRGAEKRALHPTCLDEPATLRYTSGTTGQPKGVVFRHDNVRWMGECLVSLLPWRARHTHATYLSFLPMNHVVEGILATYAPYYLPAPVDIFFLEHFHDLGRTLPRVRPTIFFSVPRLYEKVWENLGQSWVGRLYLGLPEGFRRTLFRPLVRRALQNKAGFDRCAQLLVGSAAVSENLLRGFHELGIEVYNAYGLTEAPLVTINRPGANRIGTVGKPLPETQVRVAEDGEVLVRGPQVTAGYFERDQPPPFQDGWLLTGDLGYLTEEGSLVISGRKKELMKTSYGKYILPLKVEGMLREIPGVVEAMAVGDGRPYCAALLWVENGAHGEGQGEAIARAVEGINAQLSHAEQIKRWAVLANDLSIERGDLTANLKLKRGAVARQRADVIAALYGQREPPPGVLSMAGAEEKQRQETGA